MKMRLSPGYCRSRWSGQELPALSFVPLDEHGQPMVAANYGELPATVSDAWLRKNLRRKEKQWSGYNLRGKKFIAYHKIFEYLANEFGFELIAYVEPKPGIPPSAGWVEKIIEMAKRMKPDAILTTSYYGTREVTFLISEKRSEIHRRPPRCGGDAGLQGLVLPDGPSPYAA